MSMAIQYSMQKRAKKMAKGGAMCEHGKSMCEMCHGGDMAKGGDIDRDDRDPDKDIKNGGDRIYGMRPDLAKYEEGKWGWDKEKLADLAEKSRDVSHRMKKKKRKYAEGGMVGEEEASGYLSMPEEHRRPDHAAIMEDDRMLDQHGTEEVGAMGMEEDNEPQHERMVSHPLENQDDHEDMVGRIMRQRTKHFSKGGQVANDTPITADFEKNQFDDLVKDDDLEQHYTGANSGDEIGDEQEDEDRRDIVARIMKSRRLKDRLPHPA